MDASAKKSKGLLIAEALRGSWRQNVPPWQMALPDLESIAPLLLNSGAAALCWRRLQDSTLKTSQVAAEFQQVYRRQTLRARVDQIKIASAVNLLRTAGIEPILVKGWAIARLYPEKGARPYGDIDLCVRPRDYETTRAVLRDFEHQTSVDLHKGFSKLGGGNTEEIYARSELVKLDETDVRVPAPEDQLRILSFHMLREGAWRPLWLCDVATALELRPATFNWEHCFGSRRQNKQLVSCAIELARQLLGANLDDVPFATGPVALPSWVVPTIQKEWESPLPAMTRRHAVSMGNYLRGDREPFGLGQILSNRWPNPVEASVVTRAPFNEFPRMPFQVGTYLLRALAFLLRLASPGREPA